MRQFLFIFLLLIPSIALCQDGSMALAPARFELEMQPGTETTVVVSLDYKGAANAKPARIVASLADWDISKQGQVEFFPARTRPRSAAPWMLYTPGEAAVMPGSIHQIRVTVSVPQDAEPGDHLAALLIEQRPESLKQEGNSRQMIVRYRMASVFYIKVGKLTRRGDLYDLLAEETAGGIAVTPKFRNEGNSVIRPTASLTVLDAEDKPVADVPETEVTPVLGQSETTARMVFEKALPIGKYTVKYRVDFQDGRPVTEGVTQVNVRTQVASSGNTPKRP